MTKKLVYKFELRDLSGVVIETRRILAPEEPTYDAVAAAVERLFEIDSDDYIIIWTDEDGSEVIVRSTEEVAAARVAETTHFTVLKKTPIVESKHEQAAGRDFERRRFGDKMVVDGVLQCDTDDLHVKGNWLSKDRFVAHYEKPRRPLPGEHGAAPGTFLAKFDYFGAETAFLFESIEDDELLAFSAWDRKEPWTWSDDRKQKHARLIPKHKKAASKATPSPGTLVELVNLTAEKFNGAKAYVVSNRADGRCVVELLPGQPAYTDDDSTLAVKPENVKVLLTAGEAPVIERALELALADFCAEGQEWEDILKMTRTLPLCVEGVTVGYFEPYY